MANFRGHLTTSASLGVAYGAGLSLGLGVDWPTAAVVAGATTIGGLLPDLDSDSGRFRREIFSLAAAVVPLFFIRRLARLGLTVEELWLALAGIYLGVRYVLPRILGALTVHRGMFHSVPALAIAGMLAFLSYHHPSVEMRGLFALGVMIGFLSHLVLDEIYSVDLSGLVPRLNKAAGTALKMFSPSPVANTVAYGLVILLAVVTFNQVQNADSAPLNSENMPRLRFFRSKQPHQPNATPTTTPSANPQPNLQASPPTHAHGEEQAEPVLAPSPAAPTPAVTMPTPAPASVTEPATPTPRPAPIMPLPAAPAPVSPASVVPAPVVPTPPPPAAPVTVPQRTLPPVWPGWFSDQPRHPNEMRR